MLTDTIIATMMAVTPSYERVYEITQSEIPQLKSQEQKVISHEISMRIHEEMRKKNERDILTRIIDLCLQEGRIASLHLLNTIPSNNSNFLPGAAQEQTPNTQTNGKKTQFPNNDFQTFPNNDLQARKNSNKYFKDDNAPFYLRFLSLVAIDSIYKNFESQIYGPKRGWYDIKLSERHTQRGNYATKKVLKKRNHFENNKKVTPRKIKEMPYISNGKHFKRSDNFWKMYISYNNNQRNLSITN
jgi:hypothetical protein